MSDIAMPAAVKTYRHAPWCTAETVVDGEGVPRCNASGDGTCGRDPGGHFTIIMDDDGKTLVCMDGLDPIINTFSPNEMLAFCLEGVKTALLAGGKVEL